MTLCNEGQLPSVASMASARSLLQPCKARVSALSGFKQDHVLELLAVRVVRNSCGDGVPFFARK